MSGIVNSTGARSGIIESLPTGHIFQTVHPTPQVGSRVGMTNELTTTYQNFYEVPITLKGGNSNILIIFSYNYYLDAQTGLGMQIREKAGTGVTTSDTEVHSHGTGDGTGPLHAYFSATSTYNQHTFHTVADATSHSAGTLVSYGFFFKKRSEAGYVPPDNSPDGYFSATLMEIPS